MIRFVLALCITNVTVVSAFAQNPIKPPKLSPLTDITVLAHAKSVVVDDESVIRFAFPKWKVTWKTETTEETVLVDKVETKVVNGKKVEVQTQVPESRRTVSHIPILNPNGMAKSDIPLGEVTAWDLAGKKLSPAELKTRLKDAKPALMFEEVPEDGSSPLDPYYAAVFRPELIVVYSVKLLDDVEASTPYPPIPESQAVPRPAGEGKDDTTPTPPAP